MQAENAQFKKKNLWVLICLFFRLLMNIEWQQADYWSKFEWKGF